jgi:hypothetical protein
MTHYQKHQVKVQFLTIEEFSSKLLRLTLQSIKSKK